MEEAYLRAVLAELGGARDVLELGCGMSEPIARYFIDAGCQVTGIDAAPAMLVLCRERFPGMTWLEGDMRILALGHRHRLRQLLPSHCGSTAPHVSDLRGAQRAARPAAVHVGPARGPDVNS